MAKYTHLAPFLSPDRADAMQRIAESFGSSGTYADEASSEGLGEQLPQRFDVGLHYVSAGIDGKGNKDDEDTAHQAHQLLPRDLCLRRGYPG